MKSTLTCALAIVLAATCACAPANLGQSPEIIWWTDHETGDFSDWNHGGYAWDAHGGIHEIVTSPSPTRSGKYSFRSSVASTNGATSSSGDKIQSGAQASLLGWLPTEAFYSAWFYFPEAITSTSYWLFFKFSTRSVPNDDTTAMGAWDLDVMTDSNGSMKLALYDNSNAKTVTSPAVTIPIGRWFQVEAFLKAASDTSGRLTIWFDGTMAFDISGQATMPYNYIVWSVGGVTESITPATSTMYIDDAAVSTKRLGPDYPVFQRAN